VDSHTKKSLELANKNTEYAGCYFFVFILFYFYFFILMHRSTGEKIFKLIKNIEYAFFYFVLLFYCQINFFLFFLLLLIYVARKSSKIMKLWSFLAPCEKNNVLLLFPFLLLNPRINNVSFFILFTAYSVFFLMLSLFYFLCYCYFYFYLLFVLWLKLFYYYCTFILYFSLCKKIYFARYDRSGKAYD
jgi:hypothetical protein